MRLTEQEYLDLINKAETRKKNKFGAVKTVVDGVKLDSKAEARRWRELLALEAAGEIKNLQRQVKYVFELGGIKICSYVADFEYLNRHDVRITEDCKGYKTPMYRLKKKLMLAFFGIDIFETR